MTDHLSNIIKKNLHENSSFNWKKKGLIYNSNIPGFTHASHPCIHCIEDNKFIIAFSARNQAQKSHIFICYANIVDNKIVLITSPQLAMEPGEPGHFDCDGVISVCFVEHKEKIYLYYVGWQNLPNNMFHCDTGRAILELDKLILKREFPGPIIGRNKTNPLFSAATAFHVKNDFWQTWYNTGIAWKKEGEKFKHYYGIHYATSNDGVDWEFHEGMCIPFADEYEYAFGRPSVYFLGDYYLMWFAHRATKDIENYRMGFAYSKDGKRWIRNDSLSGIDVSLDGWDSEMICYPYIFEFRNQLYMLYNGNHYGKTGFGLAVLEE